MAILTFTLRIMNVHLCKLWTLSFDKTHGSNFVIKLTLNAKGIRSSASCYRLINFGTEKNECQHQIVHANLILKFDGTFLSCWLKELLALVMLQENSTTKIFHYRNIKKIVG